MIIDQIKDHEVYKKVLSDSCGGIMYDTANQGIYDSSEVLALWSQLDDSERESCGGIMKGAINFLQSN